MPERSERSVVSPFEAVKSVREQILQPHFNDAQRALVVSGVVRAINETEHPGAVSEFPAQEMNLLTNSEITTTYLIAMEGPDWFVQQKRFNHPESIEPALQKAKETGSAQTVGGAGWMNRYVVNPDGRIAFVGSSTTDRSIIAKAKKLGFEIV